MSKFSYTNSRNDNKRRDSKEFGPRPVEDMMLTRLSEVGSSAQDLRYKLSKLPMPQVRASTERHLHLVPSIVETPPVIPQEEITQVSYNQERDVSDIRTQVLRALAEQPDKSIQEVMRDAA